MQSPKKSSLIGFLYLLELISTIPSLELLINNPYIFDVDDAIFLHRRGIAANIIAKKALKVASEICVFTNNNITMEKI